MEKPSITGRKPSAIRDVYLGEEEKTFQYEDTLPPLPLPDLHQTIQKYLKSTEPFISLEQYEKTKKIASDFENGVGKLLQEKLKIRATQHKNWMYDWWLKYAYLVTRTPLSPNMSMAGPQSLNLTIWQPNEEKALERVAINLWVVLEFFCHIRDEKIRPQKSNDGKRLNMNQFQFLFNTVRIPKEGVDEIQNFFKTKSEGPCPQHIIVMCLGHIWYMDPWYSIDERLSITELEEQFNYIRKTSRALGEGQGIGALTFDNREVWAKNRRWLTSLSDENARNLYLIESSMLMYTLDESSPKDLTEVCQLSLCGDCTSRWADKSFSQISYKNGFQGQSGDHSPFDAMVSVVIGHYQHAVITDEFGEHWSKPKRMRKTNMPFRLLFNLDDLLYSSIEKAKLLNKSLNDNVEVIWKEFENFGKNWLKEKKLHPDTFIQCALQLAYYQLHMKFAPTYETASTRQFYKARTETVRSCSPEVAEFVLTMLSSKASISEKKTKLFNAINSHLDLMAECKIGEGIDRHLMGLAIVAAEDGLPTPELFTDPSFSLSGGGGNFVLSTSTTGYTHSLGGVAAMVKDGYGVFYTMLPDKLVFYISRFVNGDTNSKKLYASICQALLLLQQVINEPQARL